MTCMYQHRLHREIFFVLCLTPTFNTKTRRYRHYPLLHILFILLHIVEEFERTKWGRRKRKTANVMCLLRLPNGFLASLSFVPSLLSAAELPAKEAMAIKIKYTARCASRIGCALNTSSILRGYSNEKISKSCWIINKVIEKGWSVSTVGVSMGYHFLWKVCDRVSTSVRNGI